MKKLVNYYHLALYFNKMTLPDLVAFVFAVKFANDPDCTNPDFSETQLQALANIVLKEIGDRINSPSPKLTAQEQKDVDTLCRALMDDKAYVEKVANNVAQGNKVIFDQIASRVGFKQAKEHAPGERTEGVMEEAAGYAQIRMTKLNKTGKEAFYIRYAKTTAKGVPPPAFATGGPELCPIPRVVLEAEVIITDDTGVYGLEYINILPARLTIKAITKKALKKISGLLPGTKMKHPVISNKDVLQWGDIIYFNIL